MRILAIMDVEYNSLWCFCMAERPFAWGNEGGLILSVCHLNNPVRVFKDMNVQRASCHCKTDESVSSNWFVCGRIVHLVLRAQGQNVADAIQMLSVTGGQGLNFIIFRTVYSDAHRFTQPNLHIRENCVWEAIIVIPKKLKSASIMLARCISYFY